MEPGAVEEISEEKHSRDFFQSLEPDGGGKIQVSIFKDLLKRGLGDNYDEVNTSKMIADMLSPDEDGKISVDELVETFSMGPKSDDLAIALHSFLEICPELIPKPDLERVFDMVGIKISPEVADDVIGKARDSISDHLRKRFKEEPAPKNNEEVKERQIEMMKKLQEDIVRLGGSVPNLEDEDIVPE